MDYCPVTLRSVVSQRNFNRDSHNTHMCLLVDNLPVALWRASSSSKQIRIQIHQHTCVRVRTYTTGLLGGHSDYIISMHRTIVLECCRLVIGVIIVRMHDVCLNNHFPDVWPHKKLLVCVQLAGISKRNAGCKGHCMLPLISGIFERNVDRKADCMYHVCRYINKKCDNRNGLAEIIGVSMNISYPSQRFCVPVHPYLSTNDRCL